MKPKQKAKDLIALAVDEGTPGKERVAAACKAAALIHKYDLLSSPIDEMFDIDNDTARAARGLFATLTDPELVQNVKKISSRFRRVRRGR